MDTIKDDFCFCCGQKNERGLRLAISYPAPGRSESGFLVPEWYSGWSGVAHGGLLSTVLDEVMAHACISLGEQAASAVTAEMTVRFRKPVPTGSRLRAEGWVTQTKGRIIQTEGRLVGEDGQNVAEAHARFVTAVK